MYNFIKEQSNLDYLYKVFYKGKLIAVVRFPPENSHIGPCKTGSLIAEKDDHWRVDCDTNDYYSDAHMNLKKEICDYLGTDKVSIFDSPNWIWR